jgi:hypothetical protein
LTGNKPRILIACPKYSDDVIGEAYMSKQNAERNDLHPEEDHVDIIYDLSTKGSLLCLAFNQLLAEALNKKDEGDITHMLMCHADVAAQQGFANVLYRIMRERGDTVVSAVVNIKEPERRRTSCAVGNRHDHFDIRRYIETTDRLSMPETFCTADVAREDGEILLVNTGMWLADLRSEFWDSFEFSFTDRIMRNPATGKRQAFCVPEDWNLAYQMDEAGVPYSASWKIVTRHFGPSVWNSHELPSIPRTS